jgi:hypothetical protein
LSSERAGATTRKPNIAARASERVQRMNGTSTDKYRWDCY